MGANISSPQRNALEVAYKFVTNELKWSHSRLVGNYYLNLPTLRRVRDGLPMKGATVEYVLSIFVGIIDEAYKADLETTGGENSHKLLRAFRDIALAQNSVEVKR